MPWAAKKLEQQWSMTSTTGQISVSSLEKPDTVSSSQYLANQAPAIRERDRQNLIE
jgi:hypothetical protein